MSDINSDNRKVVIELQNVFRDFHVGDETVHACLLYTSDGADE